MIAAHSDISGIPFIIWFEFVIGPLVVIGVVWTVRRVGRWGRHILTALESMPTITSTIRAHDVEIVRLNGSDDARVREIEAITASLEAGTKRMDMQSGRVDTLTDAVEVIAAKAGADVKLPPKYFSGNERPWGVPA